MSGKTYKTTVHQRLDEESLFSVDIYEVKLASPEPWVLLGSSEGSYFRLPVGLVDVLNRALEREFRVSEEQLEERPPTQAQTLARLRELSRELEATQNRLWDELFKEVCKTLSEESVASFEHLRHAKQPHPESVWLSALARNEGDAEPK